MSLAYDGTWGYHPLVVSLADTAEPLYLVNRSGNRPSHENAHHYLDRAVDLCRRAGFRQVLLRGDTDISQTRHLDRWHAGGVRFLFGMDASANLDLDALASGGSVTTGDFAVKGKITKSHVQGTIGGGGAKLVLRTSGGGIRIEPL